MFPCSVGCKSSAARFCQAPLVGRLRAVSTCSELAYEQSQSAADEETGKSEGDLLGGPSGESVNRCRLNIDGICVNENPPYDNSESSTDANKENSSGVSLHVNQMVAKP